MTHPTDDSLKPCPFCGGAASLHPRTCDKNTPYNPADRAFPIARCGQCGAEAVGKNWGRPETAAEKWNTRALLAEQARTELTNLTREILIEHLRFMAENDQHLSPIARETLDAAADVLAIPVPAAQPLKAEQAKDAAEDAELLATVECLTDESGADYVVVLRTGRPKLYGKEHRRESAAQKVADAINNEFGRAARAAERSA